MVSKIPSSSVQLKHTQLRKKVRNKSKNKREQDHCILVVETPVSLVQVTSLRVRTGNHQKKKDLAQLNKYLRGKYLQQTVLLESSTKNADWS